MSVLHDCTNKKETEHTSDGLDLGLLEKLFSTVNVKVGDTDRLDETFLDELLHLPPGWHDVVGERNVELDLAIVSLDSVVKLGDGSLGSVDLEVDLSFGSYVSAIAKKKKKAK